jgi:hypothetical protein
VIEVKFLPTVDEEEIEIWQLEEGVWYTRHAITHKIVGLVVQLPLDKYHFETRNTGFCLLIHGTKNNFSGGIVYESFNLDTIAKVSW